MQMCERVSGRCPHSWLMCFAHFFVLSWSGSHRRYCMSFGAPRETEEDAEGNIFGVSFFTLSIQVCFRPLNIFPTFLAFVSVSLCSRADRRLNVFFDAYVCLCCLSFMAATLVLTDVQTGKTALICAAGFGHTDCARLLLNAGADANSKSDKVLRVDPPRLRAGSVCVCVWVSFFC